MLMKASRFFGRCAMIILFFSSSQHLSAERTAAEPQPAPVVKAWGILFQVMERFEEYVANKALSSIHNDDATSSSAVSMLLIENKKNPSVQNDEAGVRLLALTREVAALHPAGDAFDQAASEAELQKVRSALADLQKFYSGDVLEAARTLAHRFRCPMHPEVK